MTKVRNMPTPLGYELGADLSRMVGIAIAAHGARGPALPERCKSCAFRNGTFPNGCEATVMDALKCIVEGVPFYCHSSPKDAAGEHTGLCAGYVVGRALVAAGLEPPPIAAARLMPPWPFSDEIVNEVSP